LVYFKDLKKYLRTHFFKNFRLFFKFNITKNLKYQNSTHQNANPDKLGGHNRVSARRDI